MRKILVVLVAVLAVVLGGFAVARAAIPDANGTIHGCRKTSHPAEGSLIVIDSEAGETCPSGFVPLNWPGSLPSRLSYDVRASHGTVNCTLAGQSFEIQMPDGFVVLSAWASGNNEPLQAPRRVQWTGLSNLDPGLESKIYVSCLQAEQVHWGAVIAKLTS